jgi:hypothetical protein
MSRIHHRIRHRLLFTGIALLLLASSPASGLEVASHVPTTHALAVSEAISISVTFDTALDPATVTGGSVIVLGSMSGLHPADLSVDGATLSIDPATDFMVGEIVTVDLTSALAALGGGANLTDGHIFQFTIRVGGGELDFLEFDHWSTLPAQVPYFIYGGDLDGNGTPDAACPNEDTNDVSVFLNAGNGVFEQHLEYGVGSVPSSCYGGDLDLDGHIDIATANIGSHNMSVLLNDGLGAFMPGVSYAGGLTCRQVYGGDFDGDGDVDLVTTGFSDNTLHLHFNQGDGTFAPSTVIAVSPGPFPVFVGDMNNDGKLDLIVGFQFTPVQVQVFLNQGQGNFTAGPTLSVGARAWDFFGNDLNGDGNLDLLLAEAASNQMRVLFGNGAGGFAGSATVPAGSFPLAVFAADLDGDGDQDALASNFSSRDVLVYENSGGGLFTQVDLLATMQSGSYAWPHDLDGDGDLDVTAIDEIGDLIYVFQNQGQPIGLPPGPGGAPPADLRLLAPFPNPTAGEVLIGFEAPGNAGPITLSLYDAAGRRIRTLVDGPAPAGGRGRVERDGRTDLGVPVATGVYLVRLDGKPGGVASRLLVVR